MLLATVSDFQKYIGNSTEDSNIKDALTSYLAHASTALETRLESSFEKATRVSFFSVSQQDLYMVRGDTMPLRLGSGFIDPTAPITIRYSSDKSMLADENDGVVYTGKFMADRVKGIIHIPKSALFVGSLVISVAYTSGFDKAGKDYKLVPQALKNGALSYATNLFFTQAKMNNSAKYNKFNHAANAQTIKDTYAQYERPRACVLWPAMDVVTG